MAYKWKPSKSAKREFAQNMQNPEFASTYYARKEARAEKKRKTSEFDYNSAGGMYIPTRVQHDFCLANSPFADEKVNTAAGMVMYGFTCNEKVHHDYIHIINEKIRKGI